MFNDDGGFVDNWFGTNYVAAFLGPIVIIAILQILKPFVGRELHPESADKSRKYLLNIDKIRFSMFELLILLVILAVNRYAIMWTGWNFIVNQESIGEFNHYWFGMPLILSGVMKFILVLIFAAKLIEVRYE